jgi:hypothetical protein
MQIFPLSFFFRAVYADSTLCIYCILPGLLIYSVCNDLMSHFVFLLQDLSLNVISVTDVFMVPSTQLLCMATTKACQDALAKLEVGVPWTLADGALVSGWLPADSLSHVQVSGSTLSLELDFVTPPPTWPSMEGLNN